MSRLSVEWSLRDGNGRGTLSVMWGGKRKRHVADIWVNRWSLNRDDLDNVTWSTWDRDGTDGENATERDIATAIEAVLAALLRQRFIPGVRAADVQPLFDEADAVTKAWRDERGLGSIRWFA